MISRRLLRVKVFQILYAFFKNDDGNLEKFKKELEFSIGKTHEMYLKFLLLLSDIKQLSIIKIEKAKKKRLPTFQDLNPNTKFIDNPIIETLENDETLKRYINTYKISWSDQEALVKKLHKKFIDSDYYNKYMNTDGDEKQDKKVLIEFFEKTILNCEDFIEYLEESSIYWNDELEFVIDMIVKTIKKTNPEKNKTEILPLYKSPDDKEFAITLFTKTAVNKEKNKELITKYIKNWEPDRIAFTDMILMQMAVTELVSFSQIPVKVTLNEYIELSKYYSTKQSNRFINGILDRIIKDLKESGEIKKTGLGLKGEI